MWRVNGTTLRMSEGDYGIALPVTVSGVTLGSADSLLYTFKDGKNKNVLLTKDFGSIVSNTINLSLTEAESAIFTPGEYVYSLDWYQDGSFMCNLIEVAPLIVGDKA